MKKSPKVSGWFVLLLVLFLFIIGAIAISYRQPLLKTTKVSVDANLGSGVIAEKSESVVITK